MNEFFDLVWHHKLKRPYRLACPVDIQSGVPIVMLHGLGRSSVVWNYLIDALVHKPYRLVAFDLLGFGDSPKPTWPKYTANDHARAVIRSMKAQNITSPAILVGHSMGCLVAVRVAELRPDLVRHLVLYEMPLYAGLPEKRRYQMRLKLYTSIYNRVIKYQPSFDVNNQRIAEKLAERLRLPKPDVDTWLPFVRSLENTILLQKTAEAIKKIHSPMDVIYGSRDMVVIRGKVHNIFGEDATNITAHTIKAGHTVSLAASGFIAERINSAVEGRSTLPPDIKHRSVGRGSLRKSRTKLRKVTVRVSERVHKNGTKHSSNV